MTIRRSLPLLCFLILLGLQTASPGFAQSNTICWAGADAGDFLVSLEDDGTNQTTLGPLEEMGANRGDIEAIAWHANEARLYAYDAARLGRVDTTTGDFTTVNSTTACTLPSGNVLSLTDIDSLGWDPITGDLWAVARNATGVGLTTGDEVLMRLSSTTAQPMAVFAGGGTCVEVDLSNPLPSDIDDIGIDDAGTIFAVANSGASSEANQLITINRTDGSTTLIGTLRLADDTEIRDVEGFAISLDDELIATTGDDGLAIIDEDRFWRVDKATGVMTEVAQLPAMAGATTLEDYESVTCTGTAIDIQKTVYAGHDSGASCPGTENVSTAMGADVTYCFVVTNEGRVPLDNVSVTDLDISASIDAAAADLPLLPGDSVTLFFETTNAGVLTNTASATGNASEPDGTPIGALADPNDSDTASVGVSGPGPMPVIGLAKRVTSLQDNGGGNYSVFYTLLVENLGNEGLEDVQVTDALSVPPSDFPVSAMGQVLGTTGGLTGSMTFNGQGDINLLSGSDTLAIGASGTIDVVVDFTDDGSSPFINQATANAVGEMSSLPTTDPSDDGPSTDNGNGIPNEPVDNDPTPVTVGGTTPPYSVPALGPLGMGALLLLLLGAAGSRLRRRE